MQNFKARGSIRDKRRTFTHYGEESGKCCKVSIRYDDGGMSFMDYKMKPRGIRLSVQVVSITRNDAGTVTMEQSAPMDDCNFFVHLEDAKRYNDRRLEAIAETWDEFAGHFAQHYMTDRPAAMAQLSRFKETGLAYEPIAA